jgi:membrane associated rhomboid family serine protease
MAESTTDLLEIILKDVAAAGAEPWYASDYARATGLPRDALDSGLDRLRLSGLVRLTDWVQGRGQGYAVTPEGAYVLENPRLLDRLRQGRELPRRLPGRPAEAAAPATLREQGTTWDRGEAIREALLNPGRPVVMQTLIALNILAFVVGLYLAGRDGLTSDYLAGNQPPLVAKLRHDLGSLHPIDLIFRNEWWRLLSYCFVHIGLIHLLMNMYALYVLGGIVETMWGSARFLLLYLISGLVGGATVMVLQPDKGGVAGASGALCGMLTSMAVWVWLNRPYLPPRVVSAWMRNITMNIFLIALISLVPGVSWTGHLGGAVGGAVVAVPLLYTRFGRGAQRWLGWVGVAAVPLLALALVHASVSAIRAAHPEVFATVRPDDPDLTRLRAEHKETISRVNNLTENVYADHGKRFLEGGKTPQADPKAAAQGAAAFRKASEELNRLADRLKKAGDFNHEAIQQFVLGTQVYAKAAAAFYELFAKSVEPPGNWDDARKRQLERQWIALQTVWEAQRAAPVYRLLMEV